MRGALAAAVDRDVAAFAPTRALVILHARPDGERLHEARPLRKPGRETVGRTDPYRASGELGVSPLFTDVQRTGCSGLGVRCRLKGRIPD
jgi:hypothetical protein